MAAISIVAYNNVQQKSRDSQRTQDIKTIAKALEMYYLDEGRYPSGNCGSSCPPGKQINNSWSTTSDGSRSVLRSALVPEYISSIPEDPLNIGGASVYGGYSYDYVISSWCGKTADQVYLLTYRLESAPQKREVVGDCSGTSPSYSSSQYVTVK